MVTADEIRRFVGQRVTLGLAAGAPGGPKVTGRLAGVLNALDGLVVSLVPDGGPPEGRLSVHYHHIVSITKEA